MFDTREINDLMDAVECWEKDDGGELFVTLVGGMMTPPDQREEFMEERKKESEEKAAEKKARKERAILLKAKLISMRDVAEAQEFGESVKAGL